MLEAEGWEPVPWIKFGVEEFAHKDGLLLKVSLANFELPVPNAGTELLQGTIDPKTAIPLAGKVIKPELPRRASVVTTEDARCELFLALADVNRGAILESNGWVPWIGVEVFLACWANGDGGAAVGSWPKVFPQTLELELR